jgi:hypothetical protein
LPPGPEKFTIVFWESDHPHDTPQRSTTVEVEKPIFIVGVGRSGSTLFYRMFSEHPNVAWLSARVGDRFPDRPAFNGLLMRAIEFPIIGGWLGRVNSPGEPYKFWEFHCRGFSEPCRDLLQDDVTIKVKTRLRSVLARTLAGKRNRLLLKVTGWPRIGFLREIFRDAKFIHVRRDARAVINSMISVDWWWGWRGPQNWRWGELTSAQNEEWERFNRSFIALAGIELRILSDAMERARQKIPEDSFMEVEYEHLCADPLGIFKKVTGFCELEWSPEFEKAVKKHHLESANDKWRKELTSEQQKIAEYFGGSS